MQRFEHGQELDYIGFPGKPNEYRKSALYVAVDPLLHKGKTKHILRVQRKDGIGSGSMLVVTDESGIGPRTVK